MGEVTEAEKRSYWPKPPDGSVHMAMRLIGAWSLHDLDCSGRWLRAIYAGTGGRQREVCPVHVTVCICTRDRGASIADTLRSLAASTHADFDVVIADQSRADDTAAAVQPWVAADARYTYIRSQSVGASAARNMAVAHARGPIVAFTDDDCVVPAQWLSCLLCHFDTHPNVGQICGEVRAAPHDLTAGFIPTYAIAHPKCITSPWLKWQEGGIGANMAFRSQALREVGPFDEALGPGGVFYACEDGDMTYRMLKAGYTVLNVPDAYVIHSGFRTWQEGQRMMRHTGMGVGAAYMKHLRMGDPAILPTLLVEWMRCVSWGRLFLLRRHSGAARFVSYAQGMMVSFRYGLDGHRRLYSKPGMLPG